MYPLPPSWWTVIVGRGRFIAATFLLAPAAAVVVVVAVDFNDEDTKNG